MNILVKKYTACWINYILLWLLFVTRVYICKRLARVKRTVRAELVWRDVQTVTLAHIRNYQNFSQSVSTILHSHELMYEISDCSPSSPTFTVACLYNFCHSDYLGNCEGTAVEQFNTGEFQEPSTIFHCFSQTLVIFLVLSDIWEENMKYWYVLAYFFFLDFASLVDFQVGVNPRPHSSCLFHLKCLGEGVCVNLKADLFPLCCRTTYQKGWKKKTELFVKAQLLSDLGVQQRGAKTFPIGEDFCGVSLWNLGPYKKCTILYCLIILIQNSLCV